MTESTIFLSAELAEMGLMTFADPGFAERLVEALRRLPERTVDARPRDTPVTGSVASVAPETSIPAA